MRQSPALLALLSIVTCTWQQLCCCVQLVHGIPIVLHSLDVEAQGRANCSDIFIV